MIAPQPSQAIPNKKLLTPDEAGTYLGGIARQTLAKWRVYGSGPAFVRLGSRIFYDVADLDAFIAERRRLSTSEAA